MSGGDLAVRIEPGGRDELARLVTSFNGMASALEDKVAGCSGWRHGPGDIRG